MINKKLVITGMGAVTPIGTGVDCYWENLLAGKCGIREIESIDTADLNVKIAAEAKDFDPKEFMPKKKASEMDRFMQLAYAAAKEAIENAGLIIDPYRTGIVTGTALNGTKTVTGAQSSYDKAAIKRATPRLLTKSLGNISGCQIAKDFNIRGPAMTVQTACASGGDAVALAAMILLTGQADVMICTGGECAIDELLIQSLDATNALSATGCRPFDETRDGFVIGEGGSCIVLETYEHAKNRGAFIYGELMGWGNNNDAYHEVTPRPDGDGEIRCMKQALEMAGLEPCDIGYINAHGTATSRGDVVEGLAVGEVFGNTVPVSSTKGATGHMMGAGGICELITCIKVINEGIIPHTLNLSKPVCDINIIKDEPVKKDVKYAMSNSFGFGGQNSSLIVGIYQD